MEKIVSSRGRDILECVRQQFLQFQVKNELSQKEVFKHDVQASGQNMNLALNSKSIIMVKTSIPVRDWDSGNRGEEEAQKVKQMYPSLQECGFLLTLLTTCRVAQLNFTLEIKYFQFGHPDLKEKFSHR